MVSVYLYVPNLIGYARVLTAIAASIYSFKAWKISVTFYSISMWLDAVDGTAARYFNQTSVFGQQLDMLTDRMSTLGLNFVLAVLYAEQWGVFCALAVVDLVSHWVHMICSVERGNKSHKGGRNWFLNFYYTFPYVLLLLCVGQETFLLVLYGLGSLDNESAASGLDLTNAEAGPAYWIRQVLLGLGWSSFPFFVLKQVANVVQLWEGIQFLGALDEFTNKNNS